MKNYLWVFPFFSFLASYFLLHYYNRFQPITLPSFIGKNIGLILVYLLKKKNQHYQKELSYVKFQHLVKKLNRISRFF